MNMISVYNLNIPEYKIQKTKCNLDEKVSYYNLDNIPIFYIKNQPDFDSTALYLRNFIRDKFEYKRYCIRGVSLKEHNRINNTELDTDLLIAIIKSTGYDRYNPNIFGKRYENEENQPIDFFAYDVVPFSDDNDLTYFFQSFYWFGIAEYGEPSFIDIITVYDIDLLNRIEHHYKNRDDLKRDGFTFRTVNKTESIEGIIKITSDQTCVI